jgi:hypothetical protein
MITIDDFKLNKNELNSIKKRIYKSILIFIIIKVLLYLINKKNKKNLFREIITQSIIIFIVIYLSIPLTKKIYNIVNVYYKSTIRKELLYDIINIVISTLIKSFLYKIFYNKKFVLKHLIISIFFITFYFMLIEPLFGNNNFSKFINKFIHDFLMFYNLDLFDDGIINKSSTELYFSIISSLLKILLDKIII